LGEETVQSRFLERGGLRMVRMSGGGRKNLNVKFLLRWRRERSDKKVIKRKGGRRRTFSFWATWSKEREGKRVPGKNVKGEENREGNTKMTLKKVRKRMRLRNGNRGELERRL